MIGMLRSEPRFARWALAEGVSMVGTAVSTVVLPVLVYDLTGSAGLTGLLAATRLVPYLLLGVLAGPVADRSDRRRLIIGGNLVEGTLVATIPLAAVLDRLTVGHLFAVAVLAAVAFVFSDAATFGAVPALVPADRLARANGVLSVLGSTADIAGPVLAGVLIATIGATDAVWVDAASFGIAALVQATVRFDSGRPNDAAPRRTIRQQLGVALAFIHRQRTVLTLILAGLGNSLAIGITLGLLVPWSVEVLGYQRDDARLGALYAAIGVGSLLSGAVFPRVFTDRRVRVLTPASLAWSALASTTFLVVGDWLAPLAVAAFSFGIMLTITIGITYRQLATPTHLTSTVNTIGRMVAAGGQPLGAGLGALISSTAGITTAYAAATATMATVALGAHLALRSQDTRVPRPETQASPCR